MAVNFSDEDQGALMLPKIESEESGALLAQMMDTLDMLNKRMGVLEEWKDWGTSMLQFNLRKLRSMNSSLRSNQVD